jgi:carbamoyltransferase
LKQKQISIYDHHTCHAYFGYFANPDRTNEQLIYVADGFGDGANGTVWHAIPNSPLKELARTNQCNIGRIYRYITLILGMKQNDHEYKVMGLAPYSNDIIGNDAYNVFSETLQVDGLTFKYNITPKDHFFYFKEKLEGMRFDGIAYGLQKRTEELITEWISNGIQRTGIGNIIFCGGVAQNIKANKRIWELEMVSNLYVPPASGDESLAFGAAYYNFIQNMTKGTHVIKPVLPLEHAYLGKEYSDDDIEKLLVSKRYRNKYSIEKTTDAQIAQILSAGHVVARCCGRMEFGPRALGNRSIIADPRNKDVIRIINEMIKQRDFWMPFAPSILEERASDYLINPKGLQPYYMTIGFDTTELARTHLIGALHPYDYTARPQIVKQDMNSGYYNLLKAFEKATGVGGVLNTSFNLHGEPIVESPLDALKTFEKTGLEFLLLGNWLIGKNYDE